MVASGTLRGSSLVLRVRAAGSKTVARDGKMVTVAIYPRLRGSYRLQPSGSGPRIAVTALTMKSPSTG